MKWSWISRMEFDQVVSQRERLLDRVLALEAEIKDLHQEMRERDRDWAARLVEVVSKPADEADNLRAMEALLDADEPEPEVDGAVRISALSDYLAFINGGETNDKIHWANDYLKPAGEDEEDN